jgi:hypothetical protein
MDPPEFFAFADQGCDGAVWGHLVRAPELNLADFPVGYWCPHDSEPMIFEGRSTKEALHKLLWTNLGFSDGEDSVSKMRAFAKEMGFPDEFQTFKHVPEPGQMISCPPEIPDGWDYRESSDGVGVLAERTKFTSKNHPRFKRSAEGVQFLVGLAKSSAKSGHPASSLWFTREALFLGLPSGWMNKSNYTDLTKLMADAYCQLGRTTLAGRIPPVPN